jgi:hypothetical protein
MIFKVVQSVDREIYDVNDFVGRRGIFKGYCDSPSGDEKFTLLRFSNGATEAFWPEEVAQESERAAP